MSLLSLLCQHRLPLIVQVNNNNNRSVFVYLFTYLFTCLFTCLLICLLICLLVYLFVYLFTYLFTCLQALSKEQQQDLTIMTYNDLLLVCRQVTTALLSALLARYQFAATSHLQISYIPE